MDNYQKNVNAIVDRVYDRLGQFNIIEDDPATLAVIFEDGLEAVKSLIG